MRRKTSPDTSGSKKQSSNRRGTQQLFYTEAFKQKIVNEVLSGKLNNLNGDTERKVMKVEKELRKNCGCSFTAN